LRECKTFPNTWQGRSVLAGKWGKRRLTSKAEAAFTEFVLRHSRFVFRGAYALLLHAQDAEDAVQETFWKLYRNGAWRGVENEQAFLARATWRVAQDGRRHRGVAARLGIAGSEEAGAVEDFMSESPSPEASALKGDNEAHLHAMIDALPEELRVPLVLSAFEELNSREIGRVLSIPEGTARTRIQRARQLLRQKLEAQDARRQEARYAR